MEATDELPVRVYGGLRTAHLERLSRMVPARMLYTSTREDFDLTAVDLAEAPVHLTRIGVVRELFRTWHPVVEINEPSMVEHWIYLVAQVCAVRARARLARRPTVIASYCIANADPALEVRERWRLPLPVGRVLTRTAMRVLVGQVDRLAFGTDGSVAMYESYVGEARLRDRSRLFEALPSPCSCLAEQSDPRDPSRLVFVGGFVDRKGIVQTLAAWDVVRERLPSATFGILGKGRLADAVTEWVATRPEVTLDIDPARATIHRTLRESGVLVLLSQPYKHWREQIGLPVLEGLGHGCEVVTTTETGLADWLAAHGHATLAPSASPDEVASAIESAFLRAAARHGSLSELPDSDQRIEADRWMMTGGSAP